MTAGKRLITGLSLIAIILNAGCGGRPSLSNMPADELYQLAMKQFEKKKYLYSVESFQALIYNYPGESIVDSAQFYLGLSYYESESYELAAVEMNRLAVNYPASPFFEDAIFYKAVSYYMSTPGHYGLDQTDLEKSIRQFEDFIVDFPEARRIEDAREYHLRAKTRLAHKLYESAVVYTRRHSYLAAKMYFQLVIDEYTDTEYAAPSVFYHAEMEFKSANYSDARLQYENFVEVFPYHSLSKEAEKRIPEAAFLDAVAALERGESGPAREKFQTFQTDFPKHKKAGKAQEYLDEMPAEMPAEINVQSQVDDGGK